MKTRKALSFAVSAALLLSGCGVINSPSGTEREKDITTPAKTSEVTEDVTTTTAAITTTTAAEETTVTAKKETSTTAVTVSEQSEPVPISDEDKQLEDDYKRIYREYLLGVWKCKEHGYYTVIGINENYPDAAMWFLGAGVPVSITEDEEKLELYINNYIGDSFKTEVYFDNPDELICTDLYEYSDGTIRSEHYERIDTAEMYPETGKLNFYIYTLLEMRGFPFGPLIEIEYDGKTYSNDNVMPYTPPVDCEFELIEDKGNRIVFSSLFYEKEDETCTLVKRFRYELYKTDDYYWKLGEFKLIESIDGKEEQE